MPVESHQKTRIVPNDTALGRMIDGESMSIATGDWGKLEWTLPQDLHLSGAFIIWKGCQVGDYGFFSTVQPLSMFTHPTPLSGTTLEFYDPALAGAYNPLAYGGARLVIEFWSATDQLLERREVDSVTGTVATLKNALTNTHPAGVTTLVSVVDYMAMRGDHNLEGGIPLIGDGHNVFGSLIEQELAPAVPAGFCYCVRFKASAISGTRELACSFFTRVPEAT